MSRTRLKTVFCHAFVLVVFEFCDYRKVVVINNLHKYGIV